MFTGLIETSGTLRRVAPRGQGVTLTIAAEREMVAELTLGESVAVDGACLTVTSAGGDNFTVDASVETMSKTTLGDRRSGDALHLERALKLGDRLGGHLVSGHIDGTGSVVKTRPLGEAVEFTFEAPENVARYLVDKGSICVDGISLTVNETDGAQFSVVLIPHTQSIVHLHLKRAGDRVNLEADLVGKYIERLMPPRGDDRSPIDLETLARAGFVT